MNMNCDALSKFLVEVSVVYLWIVCCPHVAKNKFMQLLKLFYIEFCIYFLMFQPPAESPAQQSTCKVESQQPVSVKPAVSPPVSIKPALPKKPDVHVDTAVKNKRISGAYTHKHTAFPHKLIPLSAQGLQDKVSKIGPDSYCVIDSEPAAARGVSAGSDSPSWISVAKQKQKIYKENSLEEIAVKKVIVCVCVCVFGLGFRFTLGWCDCTPPPPPRQRVYNTSAHISV